MAMNKKNEAMYAEALEQGGLVSMDFADLEMRVATDKEHTQLPSMMRPRINIQGTVTGRFKAAPNLKEEE